jgi:cytochrome c-type biogenesis protein CcmH/NrfG
MKKILSIVAVLFVFMTFGCQQQKEQKQQTSPMATPGPSPLQIEQLQAATRTAPKNAQAWISLGDALMDSRRFGEAVEAYQKGLELDPKNVHARVDMGTCYRGIGQFDKAVDEYKKAIKLDPNFPNAHRNLAVVLSFDLHDTAQGIKEFNRYLEVAPNAPDADAIRHTIRELTAGKTAGK